MSDLLFNSFSSYIRDLSIKHKSVLHNDATNKAFVRMFSHDDLQSITSNAGGMLVVLSYFAGRAVGDFEDHELRQEATLHFYKRLVNTSNPGIDVETTLTAAMNIMFDFYSRIKRDYEEDDCGPLRYIEPAQMTFQPIDEAILEEHYGWEMTIPFKSKAPSYNPANWNP